MNHFTLNKGRVMKNLEVSEDMFNRLAEYRIGFETPSELLNRLLDCLDGSPETTQKKESKNRHGLKQVTTKSEVVSLIRQNGYSYQNHCIHFANINSAKPVFWLDIPLVKFYNSRCDHLYLLLNSSKAVSILEVPIPFFKENLALFYKRKQNGGDYISLEITPENLQDIKPSGSNLLFKDFLVGKVKLP
jgi:hypothetical protein